jgi:exopolyphosphatase/guanosine-5'-triphosphate,3'-diphosphate pyrophosphatase
MEDSAATPERGSSKPSAREFRAAVIDVGTNSTRVLVAAYESECSRVSEILRDVRVTRLGRGLLATGEISEEGIRETAATMKEFASRAFAHGALEVRAFGTAALREARNAVEARLRLSELSGVPLDVVSGTEEAELTFLGTSVSVGNRSRLVIDIGGGSTEIVAGAERPVLVRSVPIGCVKVKDAYSLDQPVPDGILEQRASDIALQFREALGTDAIERLGEFREAVVAVGGTATSLAAINLGLEAYDRAQVSGSSIGARDLGLLVSRLGRMTLMERERIPSLDPRRADVILSGALILSALMRVFDCDSVLVSENDILDGLFVRTYRRYDER